MRGQTLGALYLRHSQTELAHKAFSEAKQLDPDSPASWTGLARALAQHGEWTDAMFTYKQSLQLDPTQPLALLGYASTVARMLGSNEADSAAMSTDVHTALAAVSQYLHAIPDAPEAHNLAGIFYQALSLPQPAMAAFSRALELLEAGGGDEGKSAARACRINLGYACCAAGQHAEALRHYGLADPDQSDAAVCVAKGWSLLVQGDAEKGVAAYERALSMDASNGACVELGRMCAAMGRPDLAQNFLRDPRAAADGDTSAAIVARAALALLDPNADASSLERAREEMRRGACQNDSLSQREYRRLAASIYTRQGRPDLAANQIAAVVHMHPDSAEDATHLARLILGEVRRARDGSGAPAPLPLHRLLGICQKLEEFDNPRTAGAADLPATESSTTKCWRLGAIGRLCILLGRPKDAVKALQRAVHLTPTITPAGGPGRYARTRAPNPRPTLTRPPSRMQGGVGSAGAGTFPAARSGGRLRPGCLGALDRQRDVGSGGAPGRADSPALGAVRVPPAEVLRCRRASEPEHG